MVTNLIDISPLLSDDYVLGKSDEQLLNQAITDAPWCSAYHILLAKAHKNEDSYTQKKFLKTASLYTGDREVLFDYLHDVTKDFKTEQKSYNPEVKEEIIIDERERTVEEIVPEVEDVAREHSITHENIELEIKTEQSIDESPLESAENDVEELIEVASTVDIPEIEFKKEPLREKEISITDSDDIAKETGDSINEKREIEEVAEKDEVVEPVYVKPREVNLDEVITYDPLSELISDEIEVEDDPELQDLVRNQVVYNPEVELNKIAEDNKKDEKDFFAWLNNTGSPEEEPANTKHPSHVEDLLDRFINSKRSIPKIKRNFYSAEEKVLESEADNSDVISETLLSIYVTQGLYQKAIDGYNKLSLQNPTKSAYFAARLAEIKEKQKQNKE